jgi:hypothetical protein
VSRVADRVSNKRGRISTRKKRAVQPGEPRLVDA